MALFRYDQTSNKLVPITSKGSVNIPVGAVQGFALGTQSPDWLLCDGRDTTGTADELQTKYPALYTYLGNSNVLPDYRECTLVGVGQNDTDTIAEHDVYTLGQFKDDQMQPILGKLHALNAYIIGDNNAFYASIETEAGSYDSEGSYSRYLVLDSSRVTRTGTTTHGKQKGVAFYIKATSASIEVDKGLYATKGYVNDAVARFTGSNYSTSEVKTSNTWIDGKPIYRKVIQAASFVDKLPVDINNVDEIVDVKFRRQYDTRTQYMDYGDGVDSSNSLLIEKTQNGYNIGTVSSGTTIYNLTAIFEYTKTTD